MSQKEIQQLFNRIADLHILIIGDVMIDRYLSGQVDRISPEAPVPVVHLNKEENRLGGAANVALNLRALGVRVSLCSVIGADSNGASFKQLLPNYSLNADCLLEDPDRPTTVKTRVISQNQHLLRVDRESTAPLSEHTISALEKLIESTVSNDRPDLILFQDYDKGVLDKKVIQSTIKLAEQNNIPTAVDPKKENFWSYVGVSLFKPNLKEVREGLDANVQPEKISLQAASKAIKEILSNQITLITLSEKGLFLDSSEETILLDTIPRTIADVCGAGDTVISIAAAAFAAGASNLEIAQLANLAGGQVCEKVGVVPLDQELLMGEYLQSTK